MFAMTVDKIGCHPQQSGNLSRSSFCCAEAAQWEKGLDSENPMFWDACWLSAHSPWPTAGTKGGTQKIYHSRKPSLPMSHDWNMEKAISFSISTFLLPLLPGGFIHEWSFGLQLSRKCLYSWEKKIWAQLQKHIFLFTPSCIAFFHSHTLHSRVCGSSRGTVGSWGQLHPAGLSWSTL